MEQLYPSNSAFFPQPTIKMELDFHTKRRLGLDWVGKGDQAGILFFFFKSQIISESTLFFCSAVIVLSGS